MTITRLAVSVFAVLVLLPLDAFAARPITEAFSNVTQGTFARAANSIMTCDRARESAARCNAIESTTGPLQFNNNDTFTRWIDVDGVVDFDGNGTDDTYNSSTANLTIPATATVVWAGLYWHGNTRNTSSRTRTASGNTNQIRFRTSTTNPYQQLTATWCSTISDRYACYADVLPQLDVANANGTYGVANIVANTGEDDYVGGWELMVVYEDDALPLRSLTVFHGHQGYGGNGNTLTFRAGDFLTPLMGPIAAEMGLTIAEGDFGTTDALNFRSESAATSTTITNDVGNGSIERFGTNVTTRNTGYRNTLGHDSDTFNVGSLVRNNDRSATITLPGSGGEQNELVKVDFAVDVFFPLVSSRKTLTDLNGGDVVVGDTIRYTITVENDASAQDNAVNVALTDVLNPNLSFVPGSIRLASTVAGGPLVGSKTDQSGDDIATWDSTLRTLSVNLGAGSTATTGGILLVGESTSITFDAVVLPGAANTIISNSALISFEGATLAGSNRRRIATATSDDPSTQPRDTTDFVPGGDPDGDGLGSNDEDEDNDGISDIVEGFGVDPSLDTDGDGIADWADSDTTGFVDLNGDGTDDRFDFDGDGIPNHQDLDSDGDGLFDIVEAGGGALDLDNDGRIDTVVDANTNGIADAVEPGQGGTAFVIPDTDGTGNANPWDADDDDDGYSTQQEAADAALYGADLDGDGISPWYDLDSDGDGIDDIDETVDIDFDGVPDYLDADQSIITSPSDGQTIRSSSFVSTGVTEPGASVTVEVRDSAGTVVDTVTVTAGATTGAFSASFTGLADGDYTVAATATEASGATYTDTVDVVVTTIFVAIDTPTDGAVTTDDTPELVGRTNPGQTVVLVIDEGTAQEQTLTVVANAAGDWFLFAPSLADGTHTLKASVDDGTGGTDEQTISFEVDATPPVLTLDAPLDGSVTNNTTPVVSGTTDPGASVDVIIDGVLVATVTADAAGLWTYTPTTPLSEGFHTVAAQTSDDAGNTSRASSTFEVDVTSPTVSLATPVDGSITGSATPTISGTTEPGASVEITIDGTVVDTVVADTAGNWTYTPTQPLSDGQHTASAIATDDAGNASTPSSSTFTVDTMLPVVQIEQPLDGTAIAEPQPTITGTADPGAMVELAIDGTVVATVTADANGDWSYAVMLALSEGSHDVTATVDDGANTASDSVSFTVDTMPPTLVVTAPQNGDVTSPTPTVTGTSDPGASIVVTLPDGTQVRTTADSNGDWTAVVGPLPDGMSTITVSSSDSAGNESTETVDVIVDATAPTVLIGNPDDNSTKNDPLVPFSGTTSEANTEVVLFLDGAEIARVMSDATGAWSYAPTVPLAEGVHTLRAEVTDSVGNVGQDEVDFIIDSRAPEIDISSPSENEEVTVARPSITGTAPPNADVEVFIDGQKVADVTADANGDWTYTPTTDLADGPHRVRAQTTDAAGNVGNDEVFFVIDTVPPFVNVTSPADGASLNVPNPSVSGQTKPGELVEIFVDGVKVGEVVADSNGDFTFMLSGLGEGSHTVEARTDGASDTNTFTVDFTAPSVSIDTPVDGTLTNNPTPTITGTAEPGATVEIFIDGVKVGETTADANGDWSFVPGEIADGDHEIEAVATDAAGNSGSSGVITITVDTIGPDLDVTTPQNGDSGDGGVTVGGTAEPGARIEIFVDGEKVGETTAGADGTWEYELDDPGPGEHDIVVIAFDPAGNSTEFGPITISGGSTTGNNGTNNGTGNNGTNNGTGNNGTGPNGTDDPFSESYLEGGCSSVTADPGLGLFAILWLIGLGFVRRRED